MRRQPYPITDLTGGLNVSVDAVFLTDAQSPNLKEVRFEDGLVKKDLGTTSFSSVSERPMLMDMYYQLNGSEYLMLSTVDKLYKWNTETSAFDDVGTGVIFTGDEDNEFNSVIFNDLYILTNGKDSIKKYDGGASTSALGGSPPLARVLASFYNHLMLGNVIDGGTACPQRIQWSDAGNPEAWTGGTSGAFDLVDTVDWVTSFCMLGDRLYVFKERSIWEIIYVGGTKIFDARLVVDGVGTAVPKSVVSLGDEIIFFGSDNLYVFDGTHLNSVGDNIFDYLYRTGKKKVNLGAINRAPSIYVEELGEYWIALPTTSDEPDWLLKYQLKTESWTQKNLGTACSCMGYWTSSAWLPWSSATGHWNQAPWTSTIWLKQRLPTGAPTTLLAFADGTIEEDTRTVTTSNEMVWETKDFVFGQASRIVEFHIQVKGAGAFTFAYSLNSGLSWSSEKTLTPGVNDFTTMVASVDKTVHKIRGRIRSTTTELEIKWVEPWYIERRRPHAIYTA